jgi:hypothetical protein
MINHIKLDENEDLHEKLNSINLVEGTHYTFAFTAGNSIFHIDFGDEAEYDINQKNIITKYITNRSMVITDNDEGKNISLKEYLKSALDKDFIELNVNEVENLLSIEVIAQTLPETWKSLQKELDFNTIVNSLSSYSDANIKLGALLDKYILPLLKTKNIKLKSFQESSGTIKSKVKFCNIASKYITWENMSAESKTISRKILDFILKSNNI